MNNSGKSTRFWDWFITAGVFLALSVLLASIIGPRVGNHGASLGMQSLNNMHQIGIAITNYASENKGMLPPSRDEVVAYSWRVKLCQYLDRSDIARNYRKDAAWDSPDNEPFTSQWLPVLTSGHRPRPCKDPNNRGYADFGLITGPGTANPQEGPVTLDFISGNDGLGTTLLVGECSGLQLIWTEPRDPDASKQTTSIATVTSSKPTSNHLLSSYSTYGVVALFGDGSGKLLSYKIDSEVLAALCTVNGGEAVRYEDLR